MTAEDEVPLRRRRHYVGTPPMESRVIRVCQACKYMWKSPTAYGKGTRTKCPHCGAIVDGGSVAPRKPGQRALDEARGTRIP